MPPMLAVLTIAFALASGTITAQAEPLPLVVYTTTVTIDTYSYASFLETRHSDVYNMDYSWLNWSAYEASGPSVLPQGYTALVVENSWLQLTFLPELGGRLYGVTLKATGEELLYQNPVIKPTHWGPSEQAWWLALGGIEWCLPVDEHGYEWAMPWDYAFSTTAEGAIVTLWDTTATDRVRARIRVYLPVDQAAFRITPRLENPTAAPVTFKFWHNAMLAPGLPNTVGPDLRFVIPIDQVTVHSRGDDYLPGPGEAMSWPIHGGKDYSRLGNWIRWLGFFARPQAAQQWVGVYDEGAQRGVARIFPHQVAAGVKGFGFGWQQAIDWHIWTDDPKGVGSAYVELHGGPSYTFWDALTLRPGEALEWTETWLPLLDLPALSLATSELAVGLQRVDGDLHVGLLVAESRNGLDLRLWQRSDCTPLWRMEGLDLSPGEAYTLRLPGFGLSPDEAVLGVLQGGTLLALTGGLVCPQPTSHVDHLNPVQTTPEFPVEWGASDPGGTLVGYDVQVRDGDAEALWTGWLTDTVAVSAVFAGEDGHTYTFRSRAHDLFGGEEAWPSDRWQDAFTTILFEPAPVLITSDKVAEPPSASPGEQVAFRIHLRNTGNLEATLQISDPLTACLELVTGPYSNYPPEPLFLSDTRTIVWEGMLAAGQTDVTIGFDALVLDMPETGLANIAWIDDGVHPILRREVRVRRGHRLYLPVILRQ